MKMSRKSKEVLFGVAKGLVVAGYVFAAYKWSQVENPWKKGGILDDEVDEEEQKEKDEFEKEYNEIEKKWEETKKKINEKE